ncbi:MAG: tetratricopeptide repeat protein [bacterium]
MTERIRELFDAVIEDPSNREASRELEALLREQESWDELDQLYLHLAEHETAADQRSAFLREAAAVARDHQEDLARAVQLLSRSLEGDETHVLTSLAEMRRLLLVLGDWENYVDVAMAEAERQVDDRERSRLLFELGRILEERVGSAEQALEAYQLSFQSDATRGDALRAARRIYRDNDQWELVAQLLNLELENAPNDAARLVALREMANLYLVDLDQAEGAVPVLREIVRLDPKDADARARLDALTGTGAADADEGNSTMEGVPDADDDDPDAALAGLSAAELEQRAQGERGARRHELLARAAAALADDELAELPRLYLAAVEADPKSVEVYWRAGRSISAPAEIIQAIADGLDALAAKNHGGQGEGIAAHRLVFGASNLGEERTVDYKLRELAKKTNEDPVVVDWQTQRLVEGGKWRNVQQVFTQQAGGSPADARVAALREMARLAEKRLGDENQAADFWRQVHQADKDDREARKALLRIYDRLGKHKELIDVLRVVVDDIPPDRRAEKLAGLRRLAALMDEHVRQDVQTVQIYAEILTLDPDDRQVPALLIEKYEAMRRWPDLVAVLEMQAERAEGAEKVGFALQIAHLYLDRLRNQVEAATAFERVLALDPHNREALEALDAMYEKRRDWDNLVETRRRIADLADDPAKRLAAYKELADYATNKIRRPNIVQALWEQVREIAPEDVDALRALVGAYEQNKSFDELVAIIDILVDQVSDPKEQVDLLTKSGSVLQDRLDQKERAVPIWQRLLEIEPDNRRAGDYLKKALIELGDWDALEGYYATRDGWAELVRMLEGQVGVQKDDETRIDLLFRAARIYEAHLDQQDRAVRALERILQTEPGNVEAARRLEPIYTANNDHRKLVGVLEVLLANETAPEERRVLMLRSAALDEEHLRNPAGAFEWVRRVVAEHPADAEARRELQRLGAATGNWPTVHDDLASALDRVADQAPPEVDPHAARLEILLSLGRILDEQMGQNALALARYHEALDIDPDNRVALDAVEQLYTRAGDWHALLGILDRKLALAEDAAERKELYRKQGVIHEDQLEDAQAAIERYRSIIDEDAGDRDALEALRRLYEGGGQYPELHEVLDRLREMALSEGDAAAAVELKMQIGLIELAHLDQTASAIENFRAILAEDAGHAGAREALESLLEDGTYRGEVAGTLEPIYRDANAWEPLVTVLEIRLEETADPEARGGLLEQIGTLHVERTADIERAFDAFARLLREQPSSAKAIAQLHTLAEAADGWEVLAELIEQVLPDVRDDALARDLLARLAEVYEARLDNAEMAIDAHRRVLEVDAEERASIEALDRLYTRTEQWNDLLGIYRRKLELSDDAAAREALQFQIANLLEAMLGEPREAIAVYNEIVQGDAENARALAALDRLYGEEELWADLADVLGRQLALASDDTRRIELQVRLGEVHESKLMNFDLAIETYREILAVAPDNRAAIEALERLSEDPNFRPAIADILEPIYERQDNWQKLVHVYEIQREFAADEGRKVELLHRIASLHQSRGGDAAEAFRSYARAFQVEPANEKTLAELHRIAAALDLWLDLVAVYEDQVVEIPDVATATMVHKRVAAVQLRQIGDVEGARAHYEAAYQADDADMEVIEALQEIYAHTEQWNELVAVLYRKAELTEETAAKKALYFQIAGLNEEMLDDAFRAVEALRTVRELDPKDGAALDELERLFTAMEQWEDLMEVLHRKAELTADLDSRKRIYYAIGASYEMQLDDLLRAVETYNTVLEWDDRDVESLESLARLYTRLEHWDDLQRVLARQIEIVDDEDAKLALRFRVAQLHEVHLGDVETAIEGYKGILADRPDHEMALDALENLIRQDREARRAAEVIEPVLTRAGNWERMIAVWRDLLEVTMDLEVRTQLRMRIGQAYEDMLADAANAFDAYGNAFREDPTHEEALVALERVAKHAELWAPYVELVEGQLLNIPSEYVARDLFLRVARVFDEEIKDPAAAIERYRRVMEIDPDHEGAILALDRLYQQVGRWPELAEILQIRVERAEDTARVPLLLRLGALYESALEDVPASITAYKDVLDITAQEPEAVAALERLFAAGHEQPTIGEVLEPIYLEREAWAKLHDLLQALLAHQLPGEDRMRSMHRLAEMSIERLGDKERAFLWYGEAFKEVPDDESSRREVARLAEEIGGFETLVAIYTDGLQNTQDLELIRTLSHEMADIYRHRLANDEMAEQMYQYTLTQIDPADPKALKGLDVLFEEQGRWPELIEILRREVEVTYEEPELIVLMFRLGQLYERQAEPDLAVDEYNGILARQPNHEKALERLWQIYLAREDWAPLFEVYARQAENAEQDVERAKILAAQANLAGLYLDRPLDAIDLWNQVLDLRGEDAEALMALEGLYQGQESWRELVDVCERQVNLLDNDRAREKQLYAKLGRVWGDYLERERNALENWHKVLEIDAADEDALWAVRELYDRISEFDKVAEFDHRLLDLLPPDDVRRVELYRQLGRLYQQVLENTPESIQAWTRLLAMEPYDPEAIGCLEDLYTQAEAWDACVVILERKVEITEDVYDKVSILFRAAEMYEERLQDAGGAQAAYQKVIEIQPDNQDAYDQLERLYEAGEQWEALVDLLLARLEVTTELFERLDIFERTARTFEQRLGDTEKAFAVLSMAFEASLDDERFGAELARLAEAGAYWSALIETYQRVIEAMGAVPQSVPLRLRVARWWDEKLGEAQYAGTHYQHALAIEPDNVDALTALELLLERYENWAEVAAILRRKVDLVQTPEESKQSYEKLARILERYLDQPDEAIDAYRQVLLIDGADLPSLVALEGLYTVRMRWQELIDVLVQQAAVLEDPEQIVEKYLQVGELWETRLDSPERAMESYRQALSVDDRCIEALDALERLYRLQDRWTDLLDVYHLMLQVRTEPAEQLRIYRSIAELQEAEVRDRFATIEAYRQMMVIDPRDPHAVQSLDRLYRESEQWDELAEVYETHLRHIDDVETRVLIRTALAEIYRGPLSMPEKAIEALTPILELVPDHLDTLRTLSGLYADVEDWHNAIDVISRESHQLDDREALLDRQYRVGRIYQEKLGDLDQAERWFRAALEHDRNFLPALEALVEVSEARGEWAEAVRSLQMMEAASRAFADKSRYLFRIGRVYDKHIGDKTMAIDYYEQAMDMSPDNAAAAEPLVDVYWSDRNWPRAEPLLDLMLAGKQDADNRELQQLHYRIAYCAEQLHKDDKALTHYRQAYELDSTDLATLRGMGNLLFRHEDWDRAFKIYQTILVHHRESLDDKQVVEIFHQQGQIKLRQNERRKALDFFKKALDIDPQNAEILKALIELHEARNDWEDVIHYRRQIAAAIADDTERFQALVGIGDILHERMNNTRLAVDAYNDALAVQPGSRLVLGKLLALHEAAENWEQMVAVLSQLAEQETNPQRKSKYWCGVATIQKEKLKDSYVAVRSFDKGLEADPANLRAFQAIDQILTEERDYERQDRYYRKMLKRATEANLEEGLVFSLAKNLGEINRSRLQRYDEAIKAYKIALSKKPDDQSTNQILAELYELEDQVDKAIAQHYKLLDLNPRAVESYQQLRRLFMESGKYDEAWCVCQVLVFLGQASQDERVFFERYRSRTLKQAQRQLDQRHWGLIFHPEKSPLLDHLFQQLYQFTLPVVARTHKDLALHKRKTLINPEEQTPFNSVMKYVSHTTRLPQPESHRDPQNRPGLRLVPLNPPAMLVGPDVLSGRKPQELAFAGAKELFLCGQATFLASLGDTYEQRKMWLTTIVYTLTHLLNPNAKVQYDPNLREQWNRTIPIPARAEMEKIIQKASTNPQVHLNVSKWLEAVEHTGNRLGLVLSNDLGAAVQVIKNEAGSFSRAPVQDRIRELVLFGLSENYFKLREALGLSINQSR